MQRLLALLAVFAAFGACELKAQDGDVPVDLSKYNSECGVKLHQEWRRLHLTWPLSDGTNAQLRLKFYPTESLFESLVLHDPTAANDATILHSTDPIFYLTVGSRELKEQGWNVFFDNPPRRPHETFLAKLDKKSVRVESTGKRCTVIIDSLIAGPFSGNLQITLYPGCRLIQITAVLTTQEDARAILYDAGVTSKLRIAPWKSIAYDTLDKLHRIDPLVDSKATSVATRGRAIAAEFPKASVAVFPPPHQYLYPLDFSDNFRFNWHGHQFHDQGDAWGFGIRQPPEGDGRWVPWINAPPKTEQRLSFFLVAARGNADAALDEAAKFTRHDHFKPIKGFRTFTSHFHVEHTLDFLAKQKELKTEGVPLGLEEPPFVRAFKSHGVDIVHLAEFHVHHSPDFIKQRLHHLDTLHNECRRLSNDEFLLLPGEEPNVHLGGHWISFFPKPVNWLLHPEKDAPFHQKVEGVGDVYAVHNADDVLKLMEREKGLMWTAHARTKASFGFPDKYRDEPFYKSDRFLGAAWKNMPADLSQPRLGKRVLDLFDDMNNWGQKKQVLGEVDVFKVQPEHELYGHMNINYLKLDSLPRFDDGWQPVLDALRGGKFFTTTGEVLITEFTVDGAESGGTIKIEGEDDDELTKHLRKTSTFGRPGPDFWQTSELTAKIEWTFPPAFIEVIWGGNDQIHRHRHDLSAEPAFTTTEIKLSIPTPPYAHWVRLEAWDVAANGSFTQPVWIEFKPKLFD